MKKTIITFLLALVSLASCSSDPQWADEEAHEKTEQLRKQYTPIIAGTWHVEYIKDKGRFFERLTFSADPGANRLWLSAVFDENHDRTYYAYDLNALFIHADETTLSFTGGFVPNGVDGETVYTRGDAEPSF